MKELNTEKKNILFEEINTEDRTFVISTPVNIDNLKKSIIKYGIINIPYIAKDEKTGYYRVVCGSRRIQALSELGIPAFSANVFECGVDKGDLFVFSLLDNLSHRTFNIIEKASTVEKLLHYFTRKVVILEYLSLIGAYPTEACMEELTRTASLEPHLKEAVLKNLITDKTAIALSLFPERDRDRVFKLFSQLNLSASKQTEVIDNLNDICLRDGVSIETIVQDSQLQNILSMEKLNRSQKTEQIRQTIRKMRYPVLSFYEKRFSDIKSSLDITPNINLIPPPFFEGDTYRLQVSFKKPEELINALEKTKNIAFDKRFNKLFTSRR